MLPKTCFSNGDNRDRRLTMDSIVTVSIKSAGKVYQRYLISITYGGSIAGEAIYNSGVAIW